MVHGPSTVRGLESRFGPSGFSVESQGEQAPAQGVYGSGCLGFGAQGLLLHAGGVVRCEASQVWVRDLVHGRIPAP